MLLTHFSSKKQKIVIALLLFFLSWIWQSISINAEGRTWDEEYKVDMGYNALTNLQNGDYSYSAWNDGTEHPMVAKYTYAIAALPNMFTVKKDIPPTLEQQIYLQTGKYYVTQRGDQITVVNYDYTNPRILSAFFNAVTVTLVFLVATLFLPPLASFFVAFTLLTTPWFLAFGRLITYESLSDMLYIATTIAFAYLLTKKQARTKWYILLGLLSGLLLWTRYNNIYIFLFLGGWWILWHWLHAKDKAHFLLHKPLYRWQLLLIPITALLVGFATWPYLWMNFPQGFLNTFSQNGSRVSPFSLYYLTYFMYTTPLPYLVLFFLGILYAIKKHSYHFLVLLWALLSMMLFYLVFTAQGGGTRYIYSIYPVYALLVGIGFDTTTKWISKKFTSNLLAIQGVLGTTIILYTFFFAVCMIHPYYLDYYNELAGGLPGAVAKNLNVSWWGEGQREAGQWLEENAIHGSSLALKVTPMYVFPPPRRDLVVYPYNTHIGQTEYLVVSRADLPSVKKILTHYKKVYSVNRQGIDFVTVFQKN